MANVPAPEWVGGGGAAAVYRNSYPNAHSPAIVGAGQRFAVAENARERATADALLPGQARDPTGIQKGHRPDTRPATATIRLSGESIATASSV